MKQVWWTAQNHFKYASEFYPDRKQIERKLHQRKTAFRIYLNFGIVRSRLKNKVIAFVSIKSTSAIILLFSTFIHLILLNRTIKNFEQNKWSDPNILLYIIFVWYNCSDFRYESNRIFVLGWVFFFQTNFDFLTSHFWRNFVILFESYCCPRLKDISPVIIFRKVMRV